MSIQKRYFADCTVFLYCRPFLRVAPRYGHPYMGRVAVYVLVLSGSYQTILCGCSVNSILCVAAGTIRYNEISLALPHKTPRGTPYGGLRRNARAVTWRDSGKCPWEHFDCGKCESLADALRTGIDAGYVTCTDTVLPGDARPAAKRERVLAPYPITCRPRAAPIQDINHKCVPSKHTRVYIVPNIQKKPRLPAASVQGVAFFYNRVWYGDGILVARPYM